MEGYEFGWAGQVAIGAHDSVCVPPRSEASSARVRYMLSRLLGWAAPEGEERALIVVGMNPSTADESVDDPTMRVVIAAAQKNPSLAEYGEFTHVVMVNLFPLRCTEADALPRQPELQDPTTVEALHTANAQAFAMALRFAGPNPVVWAAWGAKLKEPRFAVLRDGLARLLEIAQDYPTLQWVKREDSGDQPRHPLYMSPGKTRLVPYSPAGESSSLNPAGRRTSNPFEEMTPSNPQSTESATSATQHTPTNPFATRGSSLLAQHAPSAMGNPSPFAPPVGNEATRGNLYGRIRPMEQEMTGAAPYLDADEQEAPPHVDWRKALAPGLPHSPNLAMNYNQCYATSGVTGDWNEPLFRYLESGDYAVVGGLGGGSTLRAFRGGREIATHEDIGRGDNGYTAGYAVDTLIGNLFVFVGRVDAEQDKSKLGLFALDIETGKRAIIHRGFDCYVVHGYFAYGCSLWDSEQSVRIDLRDGAISESAIGNYGFPKLIGCDRNYLVVRSTSPDGSIGGDARIFDVNDNAWMGVADIYPTFGEICPDDFSIAFLSHEHIGIRFRTTFDRVDGVLPGVPNECMTDRPGGREGRSLRGGLYVFDRSDLSFVSAVLFDRSMGMRDSASGVAIGAEDGRWNRASWSWVTERSYDTRKQWLTFSEEFLVAVDTSIGGILVVNYRDPSLWKMMSCENLGVQGLLESRISVTGHTLRLYVGASFRPDTHRVIEIDLSSLAS